MSSNSDVDMASDDTCLEWDLNELLVTANKIYAWFGRETHLANLFNHVLERGARTTHFIQLKCVRDNVI